MEAVAYIFLGGVIILTIFVATHKKMRKHAREKILREWINVLRPEEAVNLNSVVPI